MNDREWIELFRQEMGERLANYELTPIRPDSLIFETRVLMNCFYCGRYDNNWKCPPRIPKLDYQKMVAEYDHGAFVHLRLPFTKETFDDVRTESSVQLHKTLLALEKVLYQHDQSLAISFIGGSCKLCKNGCGAERCNNPYLSRTPLEAIGVNVVESARLYGIRIVFPPKDYLSRLGLLLW